MADVRSLDPIKKPTNPLPPGAKPTRPDEPKPAAKPDAAKTPKPSTPPPPPTERLISLDAFRGAIMLFMASAGFGILQVNKTLIDKFDDNSWRYIASQVEHVPWCTFTNIPADMPLYGFSLWDMIQPAFMFMVGVAAPFSLARRLSKGDSYFFTLLHALWRAIVLVLLGVFLSSNGADQTNWAFMNVLSQIGLGYLVVFLMVNRPKALQVTVIVLLLAGHWYAYFQHPLPSQDQWSQLGVTEKVEADGGILEGLMSKWSEHINYGAFVDRQLLNEFPRKETFVSNSGGYQTINFVTSIATMLLGLMIGELLRGPSEPGTRLRKMIVWGGVLIALGLLLHFTCCPIIKRIWTPSWTLYSGGVVIWMLAALYAVIDMLGWRWWSFPLVVVGMNSIAMYLMSQMMKGFTAKSLRTHLTVPYEWFASWANSNYNWAWPATMHELNMSLYYPIIERCSVLFVFWLICFWMYRQKIFVRV